MQHKPNYFPLCSPSGHFTEWLVCTAMNRPDKLSKKKRPFSMSSSNASKPWQPRFCAILMRSCFALFFPCILFYSSKQRHRFQSSNIVMRIINLQFGSTSCDPKYVHTSCTKMHTAGFQAPFFLLLKICKTVTECHRIRESVGTVFRLCYAQINWWTWIMVVRKLRYFLTGR